MIFKREPVVLQAAAFALFNLLGAFGVVAWTCSQFAAVNAVVAALLGLVTRRLVTPLADPKDAYGRQLAPQGAAPADRPPA